MEGRRSRLRITIFNASGLRAADRNGRSDPYVVGELIGKPHTRFRTRAIAQTLDPEWDEEHTIDDFVAGDTLRLKVMDEDNVVKAAIVGDDFLGKVELESEDFCHGFAGELALSEAGKGRKTAVIRLAIGVDSCQDTAASPQSGGAASSTSIGPPTATLPPTPPRPESSGQSLGMQRRLNVTIVGAHGLADLEGVTGKSDPYCVCEVPGKQRARFKTDVAVNTLEPTWNKSYEFDYTLGDSLQFKLFDKGIWPKADEIVGKAVLPGEKIHPYGFDGEMVLDSVDLDEASPSSFGSMRDALGRMLLPGKDDSPKTGKSSRSRSQALLKVKVTVMDFMPAQGQSGHFEQPPQSGQLADMITTPSEALRSSVPRNLSNSPSETQRIKVLIHGVRGFCSPSKAARCALYCVCQITGKPGSGFRTQAFSGAMGDPVWHYEQDLLNYVRGEGLEFALVNCAQTGRSLAPEDVVGSCLLAGERFLPYGYDSEMTVSNPGQGIQGLLRVRVTVLKSSGAQLTGSTSVVPQGLQQSHALRCARPITPQLPARGGEAPTIGSGILSRVAQRPVACSGLSAPSVRTACGWHHGSSELSLAPDSKGYTSEPVHRSSGTVIPLGSALGTAPCGWHHGSSELSLASDSEGYTPEPVHRSSGTMISLGSAAGMAPTGCMLSGQHRAAGPVATFASPRTAELVRVAQTVRAPATVGFARTCPPRQQVVLRTQGSAGHLFRCPA